MTDEQLIGFEKVLVAYENFQNVRRENADAIFAALKDRYALSQDQESREFARLLAIDALPKSDVELVPTAPEVPPLDEFSMGRLTELDALK
jgi:hypothetical protein